MKAKDIKVGGEYFTYVSGERVLVRVVYDRKKPPYLHRGRYQVERVDNNKLLTKWRSPQALHPVSEGYWPSMTEKQEDLGQANGEYECPDRDELQEAVVIRDARGGGYDVIASRNVIIKSTGWDRALKEASIWMKRNRYWPNIYYINERGNVDLLDKNGQVITNWV